MMKQLLAWPDYLVLVSFLVISLAIGLYHSLTGGRQKTTTEFILANRRLKVLPTAISLCVSYQSAILILGVTAEFYSYGAQYLLLSGFAFTLNAIIVERLFVPWLYPLKLVSTNEYVFIRFRSHSVRLFTSILGIIARILYMGTCMYAPSAALESVTNFPLYVSVLLMSAVCILYTALGGMRAVIWTDVFQCVTMLVGMVAIIIKGVLIVGGITNVFEYAWGEGRMIFVDWSPDPTVRHTVWSIMIGLTISLIPSYSISQAAVQRYSATESLSNARKTILLCIPGTVLLETIAGLTALVVFAYYAMVQCDPLLNKEINNENQLLPHYVMKLFSDSPGFAGLFLATLYGGALSSVSSSLSGSAANCWEDILKGYFSHLTEATKTNINRVLVVIFGLLATTVSFLAKALPGPILQIAYSLSGSVTGSLFGIYILGGMSRHGNWKGALTGGFISLAITLWISVGSMTVHNKYPSMPPISVDGCPQDGNFTSVFQFTAMNSSAFIVKELNNSTHYKMTWTPNHDGIERFYCLSYCWYIMFASLMTVIVGLIVSFICRDKDSEDAVEDRLLMKFRNCICSASTVGRDEKVGPEYHNEEQDNGKHELDELAKTSEMKKESSL